MQAQDFFRESQLLTLQQNPLFSDTFIHKTDCLNIFLSFWNLQQCAFITQDQWDR